MNCYFQGCDNIGVTKEHIPPRSFFPDGEKKQLLTVKSCQKHNNEKAKGAKSQANGAIAYKVDIVRLDSFFTALSCGIVYKSCGTVLPESYDIRHIYHDLIDNFSPEHEAAVEGMKEFYSGKPMGLLNFGRPNVKNERIYTVKVFGMPKFQTSITIVHEFFGVFQVTSMLSIEEPCASLTNGNI